MPLMWQNSLLCLRQAQAIDRLHPVLVQMIHISYTHVGKGIMKQHNYKIRL